MKHFIEVTIADFHDEAAGASMAIKAESILSYASHAYTNSKDVKLMGVMILFTGSQGEMHSSLADATYEEVKRKIEEALAKDRASIADAAMIIVTDLLDLGAEALEKWGPTLKEKLK